MPDVREQRLPTQIAVEFCQPQERLFSFEHPEQSLPPWIERLTFMRQPSEGVAVYAAVPLAVAKGS